MRTGFWQEADMALFFETAIGHCTDCDRPHGLWSCGHLTPSLKEARQHLVHYLI
jgi:hypothetical protein